MQTTSIHFISAKDCKYRLNGRNLVEFRKAELRRLLAVPLKVDAPNIPKNVMLGRIISALDAFHAPEEISELASLTPKAKPVVTEKPKEKKKPKKKESKKGLLAALKSAAKK